MNKLIFLDTETTGNDLKEDRLCQVAYKIEGEEIKTKNFKPTVPISIKAMSITNITNEMVENESAFKGSAMAEELQSLFKDDVLVAHNAKFDIAMLENEGLEISNYICTLRLARYLDEEQEIPEYNLQFLRYYYAVKFSAGGGSASGGDVEIVAHSADGDVLVLEAVFKHLYAKAKEKSNNSSHEEIIKRMIDISSKPSLIRKFAFGKHIGRLTEDVLKEDRGYLEWLLRTKKEEGTDEDWIHTLNYYLSK